VELFISKLFFPLQTTAAPLRRVPPPPPPVPTFPARADTAPHYTFRYVVQDARTGDYKTQEERRDGGKVRGTYSVAEPNGDLRVVSYSSDSEGGFRAEVRVEPGGAVLTPDDNGRTFSSFFPDPFKIFRMPTVYSGSPPEVSASPLTMMPVFGQPQFAPQAQFAPQPHFVPQPNFVPAQPQFTPQPQPQFFRPPTQQPAFDRTAAPVAPSVVPPTPMVFKPDPYPRQPETPAIPITPAPPTIEHHGDIITATAFKPQTPQQHPQIFPGRLQMMRRPSTPVQPPRPTTQTKFASPPTTPMMVSPSTMMSNPYIFQRQPAPMPFMRFTPVPPVVYPQRPQQTLWNPYDAAAMGGTPFMLVRTYLVPVPGSLSPTPVVPSATVEPQRVVQPVRPEPTLPVKTTTVVDEETTPVEKEVPTTVVTQA